MPRIKFLIISPCRNEADYMLQTLESVVAQTVRPTLWVIVDDGSSDQTPQILAEYAARYDFIKVVSRPNRGHRSVGPGVIDAFYAGYETIEINSFDYLCKLDLDLELPPRYFEILLQRMETNPRIGTCSGKAFYKNESNGQLISEKCGDENSVGMTKLYRRDCFLQIGGFVRQVMWDGIDGHQCRMLGWIACSWDEPELRFLHLRPMGSSYKGIVTGRMRHGFGQYYMGTGLAYMVASALYRMTRPPLIIGGLAMLWGYIKSMITGQERLKDPAFRRFLRHYQWACLFYGKRRATDRCNSLGVNRWTPKQPSPFFADKSQ